MCRALRSLEGLPVDRINLSHLGQSRIDLIGLRVRPCADEVVKIRVPGRLAQRYLQQSKCRLIKADSFATAGFKNRLFDFRGQAPESDRHRSIVEEMGSQFPGWYSRCVCPLSCSR